MRSSYTAREIAILAVFTLSGFAGLIYESIWSHYLKLFLGHAAYAQSLVLTIFMGGMALGAWVAASNVVRIRRLLLAYAIVELLIGALGLAFHPVFVRFLDWSFGTAIPSLGTPATVELFKWSGAATLILPQSILLGATFPLISGGLLRLAPERAGESLSLLYFTNCIGAAAGVLASGFFLIGRVGLPGTLLTAAVLNVLLALLVWIFSSGHDEAIYQPPSTQGMEPSAPIIRWLLIAAVLSGFASFVYEIAWIRMLTLVLGSSTHSFELMLAAFITGLALGGLWIRRRIDSLRQPVRFLGALLMIMGVLGALTVPAYHYTFDVIAWAIRAFSPTESGYLGFNVVAQTVAAALMIPVTFCAGMTLPIITHSLLRQRGGERAIGQVYALNTIGCIAGVIVATHVLLPLIGLKGAVLVGATTQVMLGLGAMRLAGRATSPARWQLGLGAAIVVIVGVQLLVHPDAKRLASAVYRHGVVELPADSEVLFLRDGKTATISLSRIGDVVTIATNGKPDASIRIGHSGPAPDEVTMVLAGALPALLHPAPRRVANVGFGSGLTSHVLLLDERVQSVDSIEIEPLMVRAARLAYEFRVANVFADPRSRVVMEDAKTYFSTHQPHYDVIVSEPSNPWVSGVATLFSIEFYREIRRYLAPGGLLVQWLQVYETDLDVLVSVMKALDANFADYHVYNVDDSNILIVASSDGPVPDPVGSTFAGALATELQYVGIMGIEDVTSRRIGNKTLLGPFFAASNVPANSDYFPYVDLNAARFRFMRRNALPVVELSLLPIPLQELAIPEWVTLETERSPDQAWGAREELVRRAGLLAFYLSRGRLDPLPEKLAGMGAIIEMPDAMCRQPGAGGAWISAVEDVARRTSAYLPASELKPLWEKIAGSPCLAVLDGRSRRLFDLLQGVALRDRSAIVANAAELLQDRALASPRRSYVLTAAAAAQVGLGHPDEVASLMGNVQPEDLRGEFGLALRVLHAYGDSPGLRSVPGQVGSGRRDDRPAQQTGGPGPATTADQPGSYDQ